MAMAAVVLLAGPWMLRQMISYTRELIQSIPGFIN